MNKGYISCIMLGIMVLLFFVVSLLIGSVSIPVSETFRILIGEESVKPSWQYIVIESRLPQAVTAMLCGASLAVCGLILQTAFRNPLAGPSIFGVNSGAGLGVALVMLFFGGSVSAGTVSIGGFMAVLLAAFAGAMGVMALIFFFSTLVRSHVMLLIVGIMIGYMAGSAISLLNFFATDEGVKSYMVWGMGSFGGVSLKMLPTFSVITLITLAVSLALVKPLNALVLGDRYAENLGVNIIRVRNWLLLVTGVLTAVITAFCGPVAFIGLAVPHIARLVLGTDNHRVLLPATILTGSAVALLCNILTVLPGEGGIIPLNAITPLIGAPVVIYVILSRR
ncbi:iron ABC transporter [Prevotella sp. P5-126]|uniref:iron ABC transporter permease n=1 Tax=unclassified Prevotella TaxID=2638335 RepID=UPI000B976213|nr:MULTISPECIES: iron ABC transporter permease [unclassified Prevotella]MBS7318380.1 iron ABC transporter permease [Prevotella sp.]MCF2560070.1 iron ABC transporter permease [Xylanibacter brevis]MCI7001931.1 iron ABC transporter permease [Prevotella sp.]MDD7173284.1 iron ABC transporter permease [Prevotella sp.]MDY4683440.1 iron ABC transporter permease [Prevotella sp.]